MTGLAELQGWMQAAILAGESGARAHVKGDNRLTANDRLGIYAEGYRARLIECLTSEFSILAALAGPTAFDLFARGYIAARPSQSYTLYDLGAGFADYLEASRPPGDGPQAIPAALARIERAMSEVHRERGIEGQTVPPETGLDPLIAAMLGRYWRPATVRLLSLPFDFGGTIAAAGRKEAPVLPLAQPGFVAVARANYRVEAHPIEAWQHEWLAGLPDDANAARWVPHGDARLAGWLPFAISRGLAAPV